MNTSILLVGGPYDGDEGDIGELPPVLWAGPCDDCGDPDCRIVWYINQKRAEPRDANGNSLEQYKRGPMEALYTKYVHHDLDLDSDHYLDVEEPAPLVHASFESGDWYMDVLERWGVSPVHPNCRLAFTPLSPGVLYRG